MTPHILALIALALVATPPALAQTAPETAPNAVTPETLDGAAAPPGADQMQAAMTTAPAFAQRAASSNMFEVQSSELAIRTSRNENVRAFAQHMIEDHTAAGERMKEAALGDGLATADMLMPDHQSQLDNLAAVAVEDFDQSYLAAQLAAHEEAVLLFQGYASDGEEGALRDFAAETLPTLEMHRREVEALSQ